MAYFQNQKEYTVGVPEYNGDNVDIPPGKFVNDADSGFYDQLVTLGILVQHSGPDPNPSLVVYTYAPPNNILTTDSLGEPLGAASLDENGILDVTQLPNLAITSVFVVNSQAAMLALNNADTGDVAIRTDLTKSFILADNDASVLANWKELSADPSLTGSLTAGRVPYATGQYTLSDKNTFLFDSLTDKLTVTGVINAANLFENVTDNNIAVGSAALNRGATSKQTVAIGNNVLQSLASAPASPGNVGIGYEALRDKVSGVGNVAIGVYALQKNTTGSSNIAIGAASLISNLNGFENVVIGSFAGWAATTGSRNLAVGTYAQYSALNGNDNTIVGYDANGYATAGSNNTVLGAEAGVTTNAANANLTGVNNTWVGYGAGPSSPTQVSNATAIGFGALNSASNQVVLGDASVTEVLMNSLGTATIKAGFAQLGNPITGDILYFNTHKSSVNLNEPAAFDNATFPVGQGIKVTRTASGASSNFDLMGGQGISVEGISNFATPNFYIYGQDIAAVSSGTGTAAYVVGSQAIAYNKGAANQIIGYVGRLSYYKPQVSPVTTESSAFYSEIDTHTATGTFTKVNNYFAAGSIGTDNSTASWYGYRAEFPRGSGAGAIGRWAGVAISPASPSNAVLGTTLIPTNKTLILLGQDAVPDGNWTIYSADTDPTYFAGSIILGATLGSKSKVLTNNTPTNFATIPLADGAATAGEIIYRVVATAGTARQVISGRIRYQASRDGATYVEDCAEVGTQGNSPTTGTFSGAISTSAASDLLTFTANFNSDLADPTVTLYYRFDSTDTLEITPL